MSGIEGFSGVDYGATSSSPEQVRAFQERMAEAARQLQAQQKQEQKQKKSEDQLVQILSNFIKNNQDSEIVELLARLLSYNLPAVFIISLIAIAYSELAKQIDFVLLAAPHAQGVEGSVNQDRAVSSAIYALQSAEQFDYSKLSQSIKENIDQWLLRISTLAQENASKLSLLGWGNELKISQAVFLTASYAFQKFLLENGLSINKKSLQDFIKFALQQIIAKTLPKKLN